MESPRPNGGWFRFRYDENQETPTDTRNVLLVVVALIAAVTFQAVVNPPGGVWQDGHKAGRAIYADQTQAFYVFLIANTLALSTAILIIMSLTYKFPFYLELWFATLLMLATYASAIFAIAHGESFRFRYVLSAAAGPFGIEALKKLYRRCLSSK